MIPGKSAWTLATVSLRVPGLGLIPLGALLAAPSILVSWAYCRDDRLVRYLFFATWSAVVFGMVLRVIRTDPSGSDTSVLSAFESVLWISMLCYLAVIGAWALANTELSVALPMIGLGSALGMYLYVHPADQVWKYALGFGLSVTVLGVAARYGVLVTAIAAAVLTVYSLAQGSRSLATVIACALCMMVIARRGSGRPNLRSRPKVFGAVLASFAVISLAFGWAMESGVFGARLQASYQEQTSGGQLVIFGGRTEWRAAWSLFRNSPLGYGTGARPGSDQVVDAVASATEFRGSFRDPYFANNVFGPRVDLHSGLWNLWFHFGVMGLVVAGLIGAIIVRGIVEAVLRGSAYTCAAVVVLGQGLWDLLFSPMMEYDHIGLALGVAVWLEVSRHKRSARPDIALGQSRSDVLSERA